MGGETEGGREEAVPAWGGVTHKVEGRVKGNGDREPPTSLTR